jgi:septum formation protein
MDMHLVLASASPRRRELLSHLAIPFRVWQHPFVEDSSRDNSPEAIAVNLAVSKSDQIAGRIERGDIVITADTIVWCNGRLLNKPAGREEAISMLTLLSGKTHMVVTGVALRSLAQTASFASVTGVRFRELSEEEIVFYVDNYSPYDKAGAYGIQEWIGYIGVESISGSYFNVMGLPVQKLYTELIKFTDS